MPDVPTFDELYEAGKAEVVGRNPALTNWNEGSRLDAVTGGGALLADQVVELCLELFAAQFFDSATGSDLDALVADRYGTNVVRKAASPSVGSVTWTKSDPALAYLIPAGRTFSGEVSGVRVTVTSTGEASTSAGETTVNVTCESTDTGPSQNFAIGTITRIDSPLGADPTATVANNMRFSGGAVVETDAELRDRARRYYQTLRRGTCEALRAGARQIPGVRLVTIDESEVAESGVVYEYIGDPDAHSNTTLAALVEADVINWRAAGVLVEIIGADREDLSVELIVTIWQGADRDAIGAAIRAGIQAYGDTLEPSELLRLSRLEQISHNAAPTSVISVEVVTPTADIGPAVASNAVRVLAEAISITWVERRTP